MGESTPRKSEYRVRVGSFEEDASDVLAIWDSGFQVLHGEAGERKLTWMYQDNPAGEGHLLVLEADGEPVGVHCLGLRTFSLSSGTVVGGIMADFVVDEAHRTLGPALQLLREGISFGGQELAFLYGFPNESAEAVFRRAGYRKVGHIRRYGRPLKTLPFLSQRIPQFLAVLTAPVGDLVLSLLDRLASRSQGRSLSWEELHGFDERFDALWARGAGQGAITSERSSRVLEWRFGPGSGLDGRRILAATRGPGGELVGYLVWRREDRLAVVFDVFSAGDAGVLSALLKEFRWRARKDGCTSVTLELAGTPEAEQALARAGFAQREARPVYLVDGTESLLDGDLPWHLTAMDRDG